MLLFTVNETYPHSSADKKGMHEARKNRADAIAFTSQKICPGIKIFMIHSGDLAMLKHNAKNLVKY